jgi:hypothetical protein
MSPPGESGLCKHKSGASEAAKWWDAVEVVLLFPTATQTFVELNEGQKLVQLRLD